MSDGHVMVLVDDEKMILQSLRDQLRRSFGRRFVYEAAENVEEAWEIIEEVREDGAKLVVVVSDWLMPGVRGDEFLCELAERHPSVIRIMLTGQADSDAIERVLEKGGASRVLRKPWEQTELEAAINEGLSN